VTIKPSTPCSARSCRSRSGGGEGNTEWACVDGVGWGGVGWGGAGRGGAAGTPFPPHGLCVQIYNEMVFDLLHDPSSSRPLAIHETVEDGVFVEGLTEFVVANPSDCLGVVAKGQANRCVSVLLPYSCKLSIHGSRHW
jgi:hypothetical protein